MHNTIFLSRVFRTEDAIPAVPTLRLSPGETEASPVVPKILPHPKHCLWNILKGGGGCGCWWGNSFFKNLFANWLEFASTGVPLSSQSL